MELAILVLAVASATFYKDIQQLRDDAEAQQHLIESLTVRLVQLQTGVSLPIPTDPAQQSHGSYL